MKYDCEVIRDLLSIYIDGVTNEKSNEVIEEHLKECQECKAYYNSINQSEMTILEPPVIENPDVVKYGKRIKKRRRRIIIAVGSVITVLLLGIISMALLIVSGGLPVKTSDIKDYGVFKNFNGYSNLYIFPSHMAESAQIDSYYYYYEDTFLDPTCQIYLEYSLSEEDFNQEVSRLSRICEKYELQAYKEIVNKIVYDREHFNYPAYVTILNHDHCYEYALIAKKITRLYAYLHSLLNLKT